MKAGRYLGSGFDRARRSISSRRALAITVLLSGLAAGATAQSAPEQTIEQKVERLTAAVAETQAQMDAYQKQLRELRRQLTDLQEKMAAAQPAAAAAEDGGATNSPPLPEIRERQAIADSQIATHELTKVETESKYPLKVSGLVLFNGFVNTRQVDIPPDPTYALPGTGTTGLSLRQTVLGLDARGPHLFGAASHADVRVDFFGEGSQDNYASTGLLRLRTAHAGLRWRSTQAFVELDRTLLAPNEPSSLVAVAQPEFAWSGNLWTWNPQIGVSRQFGLTASKRLELQAALIDVADPKLPGAVSNGPALSLAERSRWPGAEARIAFAGNAMGSGPEFGLGGYFSPHETGEGVRFDAWAGTIDWRLPVSRHFQMTGNVYRGAALGGLGGGGYVDYFYQYAGPTEITRALDDVGGWAQLKSRVGERLEFNTGYGVDNPFSREIRASTVPPEPPTYPGLVRNRSAFGNVIYSPSAYLLFSLEYRRLWTSYATGTTSFNDAIGIAAGYKF